MNSKEICTFCNLDPVIVLFKIMDLHMPVTGSGTGSAGTVVVVQSMFIPMIMCFVTKSTLNQLLIILMCIKCLQYLIIFKP